MRMSVMSAISVLLIVPTVILPQKHDMWKSCLDGARKLISKAVFMPV